LQILQLSWHRSIFLFLTYLFVLLLKPCGTVPRIINFFHATYVLFGLFGYMSHVWLNIIKLLCLMVMYKLSLMSLRLYVGFLHNFLKLTELCVVLIYTPRKET
jgi:hypothetical protein